MVCRITLNLREAGNNKQGWVNEPTFSLSSLRFSRVSGWPQTSQGHSHSLSEGRSGEIPLTLAPGGAGGPTMESGEIEMDRLHPPPMRWHSQSGKNSHSDLKQQQQYGLKESYSNPRGYEYPRPPPLPEKNQYSRPPPLPEKNPHRTHRTLDLGT